MCGGAAAVVAPSGIALAPTQREKTPTGQETWVPIPLWFLLMAMNVQYASAINPITLGPLCVRTAGGWWGRQGVVSDNESEDPEQSRTVMDGTG